MKNIILLTAIIFTSSVCFAGTLGGSEEQGRSFFGTSTGNHTTVNVQKEAPDPDLQANESKGYRESKLTLYAELLPYIFPFGYTSRQFSQSTYSFGALWKVDEHWHGLVKYMAFDITGPEEENLKAEHYMYGIGMRWTVSGTHQVQLNAGSSTSTVKWIDGGDYELPVFAEAKYLWCSDNTAYGIVLGVLDMPKKHNYGEEYRNAGFMYVALTFEVGIPE